MEHAQNSDFQPLFAVQIHKDGSGDRVDIENIQWDDASSELLWIHLDSSSRETADWLKTNLGLSDITCDALLDEGTRPRTMKTRDGLLVILRGMNQNPDQSPDDMIAIRMLFIENRIITIRYRAVYIASQLLSLYEQGRGPKTKSEFMITVARNLTEQIGVVIGDLDELTDKMEESLETDDMEYIQTTVSEIRRNAVHIRRYIAPQRDALLNLRSECTDWLRKTDLPRLTEIIERTFRFVQDIESIRDRAIICQEETRNRISNRMNTAMYSLAVITAIFLPLGLFTGLLGINVGGMPGSENKLAFWWVVFILLVLAAGIIAWFKKIKWF